VTRDEWLAQAQAVLEERIGPEHLAQLRADAQEKLAHVEEQLNSLRAALRGEVPPGVLEHLPEIVVPEGSAPGGGKPPLVSSRQTWVEQTRALIRHKSYGGGR
jgi:hypothetical protein